MDDEIRARFDAQEAKLSAIHISIEKIRKQLFWKSVFATIFFLLPLIGLAALIPWLFSTLSTSLSSFSNLR
jgi:hypothetical protein